MQLANCEFGYCEISYVKNCGNFSFILWGAFNATYWNRRTFGMYLKSDGFQSMREEVWTSWNHALKLCITLRLGQIILKCPKKLRSSNSIRLVVPTENGTFSKIMRRSYLIIYHKLLETVMITEPFWDLQGSSEHRVISQFYCNWILLILLQLKLYIA